VPWNVTELGHSTQSAWTAAQTIVVNDTVAFGHAWADLYSAASTRPPMPAVDFAKSRVVVVASGYRPTGGFRLALSDAHVAGDTAIITITLFTPPAGCAVTQQLTMPAIAIAMPVVPAQFRIVSSERPDTVRCN
jgi:hypothetical protein